MLPTYFDINCSNSIGVLSATELRAYKNDSRYNKLEQEFNSACNESPVLRENYKHLFTGNYYTEEARMMKRALAINARKFRRKKFETGKQRRSYASKQKSVTERKELLSDRIDSRLTVMRDLQVSYTCTNVKNSPIILIPADVKVSEITDDIQDEQIDEYVPVSLAAVPAGIRQRSRKEESRFISQCFVTSEICRQLVQRDTDEIIMLNRIDSTTNETNLSEIVKTAMEHRISLSMPLLAQML